MQVYISALITHAQYSVSRNFFLNISPASRNKYRDFEKSAARAIARYITSVFKEAEKGREREKVIAERTDSCHRVSGHNDA